MDIDTEIHSSITDRAFRAFLKKPLLGATIDEFDSFLRGEGLEFSDLKAYSPGDDVRRIDWKVTARSPGAYVRVYRQQVNRRMVIILDVSSSMQTSQELGENSIETLLILSRLAMRAGCRLSLVLFSDQVCAHATFSSKKGICHIREFLQQHVKYGGKSNIQTAVELVRKNYHRQSICFVLSDFFISNVLEQLRLLSSVHHVIPVHFSTHVRKENRLPRFFSIKAADSEDFETRRLTATEFYAMNSSPIISPEKSNRKRGKLYPICHIGRLATRDLQTYFEREGRSPR